MAVAPFSSYLKSAPGTLRDHTGRIPSTHDDSTIVARVLDLINDFSELINPLPRIISLTINILRPKMSPLKPIHRSQITHLPMLQTNTVEVLSAAVTVPDLDSPLREMKGVGIGFDEPEKLFEDGAEEDSLGGEEGKNVVAQRETHLRWREDG